MAAFEKDLHRVVGRLVDVIAHVAPTRHGEIVVELTGTGARTWRFPAAFEGRGARSAAAKHPLLHVSVDAKRLHAALGRHTHPADFVAASGAVVRADPAFAGAVAKALLRPLATLARTRKGARRAR